MPGHLRRRPTQRSSATPICPPGGDGTRRFLCRSSSKIQGIEFVVASRTHPVARATNVTVFMKRCTKGSVKNNFTFWQLIFTSSSAAPRSRNPQCRPGYACGFAQSFDVAIVSWERSPF